MIASPWVSVEGVEAAPLIALLQPIGGIRHLDLGDQVFDHEFRVSENRNVGAYDLIELGGIDVDVNFHRFGTKIRKPPGDAVVPTPTDRHDQIAARHRFVRVGGAVHSHHAEVKRVGFIHCALAEQGGYDGCAQLFGECGDRLAGTRDDRPLSDVKQRALCGTQKFRCFGNGLGGSARRDFVARQIDFIGEGRVTRPLADVLGDVDEYRPRSPAGCDVEGLADDARNIGRVLDEVGVLDDRIGDARDVRFLERILAKHGCDGLARYDDDRCRVHQCREQSGHGIGRSGAGGHEHDARAPLLVAGEDQFDLGVHQRVE